ncbi:hypothetical protein BV20DRAFT_527633 [Pilatotrama ljubarskyi]|nr:hypothetical protein BV20DRAFT_527633 [Pilatotrama ljubarskyi]
MQLALSRRPHRRLLTLAPFLRRAGLFSSFVLLWSSTETKASSPTISGPGKTARLYPLLLYRLYGLHPAASTLSEPGLPALYMLRAALIRPRLAVAQLYSGLPMVIAALRPRVE